MWRVAETAVLVVAVLRLGKYHQNGSCYCQLRRLRLVAIFQMAGTGKSQDFGTSSSVQSLGRLTYQVILLEKCADSYSLPSTWFKDINDILIFNFLINHFWVPIPTSACLPNPSMVWGCESKSEVTRLPEKMSSANVLLSPGSFATADETC